LDCCFGGGGAEANVARRSAQRLGNCLQFPCSLRNGSETLRQRTKIGSAAVPEARIGPRSCGGRHPHLANAREKRGAIANEGLGRLRLRSEYAQSSEARDRW